MRRALLRPIALLLIASPCGCGLYRSAPVTRPSAVTITSEPPEAEVELESAAGDRSHGVTPLVAQVPYTVSVRRFNRLWWVWVGISALALGGGLLLYYRPSPPKSTGNLSQDLGRGIGYGLGVIGLIMFGSAGLAVTLPLCIAGEVTGPRERVQHQTRIQVRASRPGYEPAAVTDFVPAVGSELRLRLRPVPASQPLRTP